VAAQVAVCSTVILGVGALAIDLSAVFTTQTELQVAADSAALAAAAALVGEDGGDPVQLATQAANDLAGRHPAWGELLAVGPGDIEFGRAIYDPYTEKFDFQPGGDNYDAVRVTVNRDASSAAGAMPLIFANVFGYSEANLSARAAAVLIPRDISVVIDLSNSMCYDSQLRYWNRQDGGFTNLRDVWCALDGPEPSRPYVPGPETDTEYAGDTGPTFGQMVEWGDPLLPGSYSPSSDPGLWYIPQYQDCTLGDAATALTNRGYSVEEIDALLSGLEDGNYGDNWRNRAGVIMGLAIWHSGKTGGFDPGGGNGNNIVGNSETEWYPPPAFALNWDWPGYVNRCKSNATAGGFQYRLGLKTLTDYILDKRPEAFATDGLHATPEQPLRAVKDAVQTMIDTIDALDSLDKVSLEIFASTSKHEIDLTDVLQAVPNELYGRQSGHYDRCTNIGGGLFRAYSELTSDRARGSTRKIVVLMSDGVANVDENGNYIGDGADAARTYALDMAQICADEDFRIYSVSVGYNVDRQLLQEIATIGNGKEFYAVGSPEEYSEQLELIFRTLGGKRPVALIE
jgi:hypothetical protein